MDAPAEFVDFAPDRSQLARVEPAPAPPAWAAVAAIAVALGLGLSLALPPASTLTGGKMAQRPADVTRTNRTR